jgi:hypothetical protein
MSEQIPLMQQTIVMLTDKVDRIESKQDEEARKNEKHRQEDYEFRAQLLEKLETRFAWKWTEKIIIFIGWIMWTAIVGALMTLILRK